MLTDFRYKGFEPDTALESEAENVLDQIQKCLPLGTAVIVSLEFDGKYYVCSIDAHLKRGSLYAEASHPDPILALQHAEETLLKKVFKTQDTRFFTRSQALTTKASSPFEFVN